MARRRISGAAPLKEPDTDPVALGREAWQRRRAGASRDWADWVLVGAALRVGRDEAMAKARTNKPSGKNYNTAFHHWLQLNDFADLDGSDRGKLLQIIDHLEAVEAWRATLTEAERLRWNHPSSVWRAYECPNRGNRGRATEPHDAFPLAPAQPADGDNEVEEDDKVTAGRLMMWARKVLGAVSDAQNLAEIDAGLADTVREAAVALTELADNFDQRLGRERKPRDESPSRNAAPRDANL